MKDKIIFVFLKNKLISLDSIIPFSFEINKQCGFQFIFVVFEEGTYEAIKYDNLVLRDAIDNIGSLMYIHGSKKHSKILRKFLFLFKILKISFQVNFKNRYILHFGGLNEKPLVFMRWLFKYNKRILCESSHSGRTFDIAKVEKGKILTHRPNDAYQYRTDSMSIFSKVNTRAPLDAKILVGFHGSWNYFKHKDAYKSQHIVFSDSRNSPAWNNFLLKKSEDYVNQELFDNKIIAKKIIVVIIGRLKFNDSTTKLHRETFKSSLKALSEYSDKFPIFIKPKIYDDLRVVNSLIEEVSKNNRICYVLTKLHPMVLSKRAIMSVFDSSSSVIFDFSNSGVPVVQNLKGFSGEYLKKMTSSMADYVVNDFNGNLRDVCNKILVDKKSMGSKKKNFQRTEIDCSYFLK
jgi:hypothetical protein